MTSIIYDLLLLIRYYRLAIAGQLGRVSTTLTPRFYGGSPTQPICLQHAHNPLGCHDSGIRAAPVCEEVGGGASIGPAGEP